jgi:hypothetical protein
MPIPQPDLRSERRKALDEQLASEPQMRIFATVARWPLSGWLKTGWCGCSTR